MSFLCSISTCAMEQPQAQPSAAFSQAMGDLKIFSLVLSFIGEDSLRLQRRFDALKQVNKKLYLLNSDYDPTNLSGLKKNHLPYKLTCIHATGHFPMVEKPAEFNKLLAKIIKEI